MKIQWLIASALVVAQGNSAGKGKGKNSNGNGNGNGKPPKDQTSASITYSGSGCPPNSAAVALAEDRSSFTLIFSQFIASKSPSQTDSRKDCVIDIDIRYPDNWSFGIQSIDYRGYAQLPAGISAVHRSRYNFQGNNQPNMRTSMVGPRNEDYLIREDQPIEFSKCRSRMKGKIHASVQLFGNSDQPAQLTVDSVDGSVRQTFALQWKQC
jgi:hypothetical protein